MGVTTAAITTATIAPRANRSRPGVALSVARDDASLLGELLQTGYRCLALKHHPDRDGNTQMMQKLNALVEAVPRQLSTQH